MTFFRPLATAFALLASPSLAFLAPHTCVSTTRSSSELNSSPFDFFQTEALTNSHFQQSFFSLSLGDEFGFEANPLLSGLNTLFSIIGGFIVVSLVLSVIVFVFIVPQAARELENNVRTEYPDLWNEYQAKLDPGEDFSTRPDLMSELGNKYQRLQMERFDKAAAQVQAEEEAGSSRNDDVEITSKETKKD